MKPETQQELVPHAGAQLPATQEPSTGAMLQAIIDRGITAESVAVVERLVALKERQEQRDAEKAFARAFVALQADMAPVQAIKAVPNRDGTTRFMYAPFEHIMAQVRPLLQRHGFTITFSADIRDDRVVQTCTLQHIDGHKQSTVFMAKIGSGPPQSSGAQADGAASTYAKRQALCSALNIVVEHDTDGMDARDEGKPISFEQAQTLREMVKETRSDEAAFLKFAGATSYEEIGSARYDQLFHALQTKMRR